MRRLMTTLLCVLVGACQGKHGGSALVNAARSGDATALRAMATVSGDLDSPEGGNGWTPLMHAIHKGQLGSVQALLDRGADPNRRSEDGVTPLMMAAGYGYTSIVTLLLHRGADPALISPQRETALDWALSGMNDIDRFTLLQCQDETVRALHAAAPQIRPTAMARRIASMKRCQSLALWANS